MEITVKGKQMDVGGALRGHVTENLGSVVTKYFDRALDATVTFSKINHGFRSDILVHPGRGLLVQGVGEGNDAHVAFDNAVHRIEKQLRRYKKRLRDHHKARPDEKIIAAQRYVLAPESEEEEAPTENNPAIIAEMPTSVASLTVGEAVMRMDLADVSAMMFRNSAHDGLNVVYRRADGNIGWIDPSEGS